MEDLRLLAGYNASANRSLFEAAVRLTAEERERDLRASFSSLQGTLVHLLWGQRGWLHFWQKGKFVPLPSPRDDQDFAILHNAWSQHEEAYGAYLLGLT